MIHIVHAHEAQQRTSFGVAFDLLAAGPQCMMTQMHYRVGNLIPFHSHPNEQIGYILSGRVRILTRDTSVELGPGDTYSLPADVEHSIEIISDAEEVQVFAPPRPEFRRGASAT
jgi:quercetin dioxygenase-like cupin family protein